MLPSFKDFQKNVFDVERERRRLGMPRSWERDGVREGRSLVVLLDPSDVKSFYRWVIGLAGGRPLSLREDALHEGAFLMHYDGRVGIVYVTLYPLLSTVVRYLED